MSDTIKRPYEHMSKVASGLVERLRPACQRIEIAGSIRRHKPLCGDIELVLTPIPLTNLFGEPTGTTEVDVLLSAWPVTFVKNGQKYKQITFVGKSGEPYTVDLFIQPDPATWGINYLIRTGSADFSHKMVTKRTLGGLMPDEYMVRDARVWRNGATVDTPEEQDIFALWKLDFIQPEQRV